jgi:hypothetical protein
VFRVIGFLSLYCYNCNKSFLGGSSVIRLTSVISGVMVIMII